MDACHVLLGIPWQSDLNVLHKGKENTYTFSKYGYKFTLCHYSDEVQATTTKVKENQIMLCSAWNKEKNICANTISTPDQGTTDALTLALTYVMRELCTNHWVNKIGIECSEELIKLSLHCYKHSKAAGGPPGYLGSGTGLTVQGLVSLSSLVVQEIAKFRCDMWSPIKDIDGTRTDVNADATSPNGNDNEEKSEQLVCSDAVQQETDEREIPTIQVVVMESEMEISSVPVVG
ncbi:hypothetical protein Tco_0503402 [Tanacetum coccineum]